MTQYDHNYLCYPHLISTTQSQISDDESGKIQYNINSQGFRGPDFNNVGVVALTSQKRCPQYFCVTSLFD